MSVHTSPLHNQALVFDKAALMRHVDNDPELLRDIVNLFLQSAPPLLADIKDAVARVDAPALFGAAHALHGAARNFFAGKVEKAALALEIVGQNGDFSDAVSQYKTLEKELDELCSALSRMLRVGPREMAL